MGSEKRKRAEELFQQAMDLPPEQREAFLQEHCANEPSVASEVRSLLAIAESQLNGFLSRPVPPTAPGKASAAPPSRIGHYTILRRLGRGGMGVVYEARQDHPRRVVALKVIKPGNITADQLRQLEQRFDLEAQVLGRLQHPGIAQIFEAGVAKSGSRVRPYFAMELVRGKPLAKFAAERQLNLRQRLELFAQICDAVQHAHQRGVIHRDLKPENILVTEEGQPKILDFGVARVTDADLQATTVQTDIGQLIGTIPYMSPEQVGGDPHELDTRSDVYALGVVLYELLAGRLPYDLSRRLIPEAVRIIREEEPTRLSSVSRSLRGDVETIVGKSLEKEKDRRYASAAEMAADIRRFLDDQPILAHPPSAAYTFAKFLRRHRAVAATSAAAVALVLFGLIAGVSSYVAIQQSARREAENATRDAVAKREETESERQQAEAARVKAEQQLTSADEGRQRAEAALVEAEQKRKEAEGLEEKARRLSWDLIRELPPMFLARRPGVPTTEGSRYLRAAVEEFLSSMEQRAGEDSQKRLEIARIRGQLGDLSSKNERGGIGSAMQGYSSDRRLRDRWSDLTSRSPDVPDEGFQPNATSAPATGFGYYLKELQSLKKLAKDRPDDPTIRSELFQAYVKTGDAARQEGKGDSALKYYAQAMKRCPTLGSMPYASQLLKRAEECVKEEALRVSDAQGARGALAPWMKLAEFCDTASSSLPRDPTWRRELAETFDLAASSVYMIGSEGNLWPWERVTAMNRAVELYGKARDIFTELKDKRTASRLDGIIANCKASIDQIKGKAAPKKPSE